jgi:hypothetical protein
MLIIHIILIILWFQVRGELGLADHVWQNKRAAIAQEVEGLGPQFRQAMHDGWLKYIKATYAAQPGEEATGPSIGQGRVVVEDDWARFPSKWWSPALEQPLESLEADFHNEYSPATPLLFCE